MKPPKTVRSAFRAFLGVKKKNTDARPDRDTPADYRSSLVKSRNKFGSIDHLNRGRTPERCPSVRSQSQLHPRSSSMPPTTRQRIEEWNRNSPDEFDEFDNCDRFSIGSGEQFQRMASSSSARPIGRSQSLTRLSNLRTSQSMPRPDSQRSRRPRDNFESNTLPGRATSYRDSGAFDMYINDSASSSGVFFDDASQQMAKSNSFPLQKRTASSSSRLANRLSQSLPRSASFSTLRPDGARDLRTVSHVSNASERLLSCMSALDKLGEKLERVTGMSEEDGTMRNVPDRGHPDDMHLNENRIPVVDWQMGGEDVKFHQNDLPRKERRKSTESSSTDSGITSSCEWGQNNHENPSSRPRSSQKQRRRSRMHDDNLDMQPDWNRKPAEPERRRSRMHDDNLDMQPDWNRKPLEPERRRSRMHDDNLDMQPDWNRKPAEPERPRHLRSDSMSSGYSSGSGGVNPARSRGQRGPRGLRGSLGPRDLHDQQYPIGHGYPYEQDNASLYSLNGGDPRFAGYDYGSQQPVLYPPGYGTGYEGEDPYGYGGYGYPSSSVYEADLQQNNGWFYLPSVQSHMPQHHSVPAVDPTQQYPAHDPSYPSGYGYPYPYQMTMQDSAWSSTRYGALQDSFLDPAVSMTPLATAISRTCADDSRSDSSRSEIKKFGSFRFPDGEKPVVTPSIESRRRKTVRFSQTVNQRVETGDSEMEDSTSFIKGCSGEESYDVPSAWKAQSAEETPSADRQACAGRGPVTEPIYEFPAGHIEKSCMCSDCILARKSCQLQAPASYAYY